MAFLVLLTAAAWTGIVASDLWRFLFLEHTYALFHNRIMFPREFEADPKSEPFRSRD
jgi:hypothetical protein